MQPQEQRAHNAGGLKAKSTVGAVGLATGFLDKVNLAVWHMTPGMGPEWVFRVGVKLQAPSQVPSAEAEDTGSLVMHRPQVLGLGVPFPLTLYGAGSSSLSLTVERTLRHTQAPEGLLQDMHRPACVLASGSANSETPDCPEPLHSSHGMI